MIQRHRFIIAFFLTAVYLGTVMSPLVPLALCSPAFARAATGESAGAGDTCSCSAEQRANHTCCCSKNKPDCHGEIQGTADCCNRKAPGSAPILSCGCSGGGTKQLGLWSGNKDEQFPFRFYLGSTVYCQGDPATDYRKRFAERHDDPPDPPPKLFLAGRDVATVPGYGSTAFSTLSSHRRAESSGLEAAIGYKRRGLPVKNEEDRNEHS